MTMAALTQAAFSTRDRVWASSGTKDLLGHPGPWGERCGRTPRSAAARRQLRSARATITTPTINASTSTTTIADDFSRSIVVGVRDCGVRTVTSEVLSLLPQRSAVDRPPLAGAVAVS